jgi:ubiquinone biosynthesis protein
VTGLFHQALLTIIGATCGVMAALLLGSGDGPRISTGVALFPLLGYSLLIVAVVLVLRVLVVIFRRD